MPFGGSMHSFPSNNAQLGLRMGSRSPPFRTFQLITAHSIRRSLRATRLLALSSHRTLARQTLFPVVRLGQEAGAEHTNREASSESPTFCCCGVACAGAHGLGSCCQSRSRRSEQWSAGLHRRPRRVPEPGGGSRTRYRLVRAVSPQLGFCQGRPGIRQTEVLHGGTPVAESGRVG